MEKGGRERRHTGEEGGAAAPLASHPLQEGPGQLRSALALLLKFQLCAQPSWLAARHVPAPGWAAGSGARGGHMDKKPGNVEQRARCPLGPGTQNAARTSLALPSSPHGGHGPGPSYTPRECLQVRLGAGHQGDQEDHMVWLAQAPSTWTTEQVIGLTSWPQGCVERQVMSWSGCRRWGQLPGSACQLGDLRQVIHLSELHFPFIEKRGYQHLLIHNLHTCTGPESWRTGSAEHGLEHAACPALANVAWVRRAGSHRSQRARTGPAWVALPRSRPTGGSTLRAPFPRVVPRVYSDQEGPARRSHHLLSSADPSSLRCPWHKGLSLICIQGKGQLLRARTHQTVGFLLKNPAVCRNYRLIQAASTAAQGYLNKGRGAGKPSLREEGPPERQRKRQHRAGMRTPAGCHSGAACVTLDKTLDSLGLSFLNCEVGPASVTGRLRLT